MLIIETISVLTFVLFISTQQTPMLFFAIMIFTCAVNVIIISTTHHLNHCASESIVRSIFSVYVNTYQSIPILICRLLCYRYRHVWFKDHFWYIYQPTKEDALWLNVYFLFDLMHLNPLQWLFSKDKLSKIRQPWGCILPLKRLPIIIT